MIPGVDLLIGDCRERLRDLPDESIHCVVTSPPYYGLRDYGTASWEGGAADCDHGVSRWEGEKQTQGAQQSGHAAKADRLDRLDRLDRKTCAHCGAIRIDRQIGLEEDITSFIQALVEVFREVRRVLRRDGTLWVNIGDSYLNQRGNGFNGNSRLPDRDKDVARRGAPEIKPKNIAGIPWRLAFALQEDGWYLRQDIIWAKPNPMPESVKDRCTKAHEYVFLLSRSERYFYNHKAVMEDAVGGARRGNANSFRREGSKRGQVIPSARSATHRPDRPDINYDGPKRGRRSVWSIPTKPYSGAHFATFPPELIEPCILAGCPEGGVVLDPFGGSGTTAGVALRHGRRAILIELNPSSVDERRILEIANSTPPDAGLDQLRKHPSLFGEIAP
ncbi:MAG: site-specific DNA-methyltransferase [Alphaproteobacteria bacterium CG_4_10_14_0_2_um_filter_63_37]|nr:MAG: site-specific DNA-methyltransferase [Alphaproteobacteria bacterium CG_4_10_14_0_2_um_filter_63_37]